MKKSLVVLFGVSLLSSVMVTSYAWADAQSVLDSMNENGNGNGNGSGSGNDDPNKVVNHIPSTSSRCTGPVCKYAASKLTGLDAFEDYATATHEDRGAAEMVGNTITPMEAEEKERIRALRAEQRQQSDAQYAERLSAKKQLQNAQKQRRIQEQFNECMAKAQGVYGENNQNAQTMCRVQQYRDLMKSGLTDEARKLGVTSEDIRTARETQAAMNYADCIKKSSESACQKKLDSAYEQARKEYYEAEPDQARKEISDAKEKCTYETTGASAPDIEAYCKMKYKEALEKAGLKTDAEAVDLTAEEKKAAREVQADQDYDKCIKETKSESKCLQKLNSAYDEAKMDYYRENPELARKDAYTEYEKCTAENTGARGEAYCKSKTKEALDKVGLTDDIKMYPEDTRMAKEVQAEKNYNECVAQGKSDTTCQKQYVKETDAAKLEYYRAEPEKAKQEIETEYQKCKTNANSQQMQKCNQDRESMLKKVGLSTVNDGHYMPIAEQSSTSEKTEPVKEEPVLEEDYTKEEKEIKRAAGLTDEQLMTNGVPSKEPEKDPADDDDIETYEIE